MTKSAPGYGGIHSSVPPTNPNQLAHSNLPFTGFDVSIMLVAVALLVFLGKGLRYIANSD